ncbi:hypothetical protein FOY51_24960 [Antrihabitans cavernicola]|uniref:Uncharacterized protein n=1 Tax=Antrihabitans cavernicola TaxID=2495913 RepID=A0A5A7S543_9NOCA|nr:hypothetical protein FOY51_24960 [Spelaeibacter cavernicola]
MGDQAVTDKYSTRKLGVDGATLAVLRPGESSATWNLTLPAGVVAKVAADGSVQFQRAAGAGTITEYVALAKPWAIDAAGRSLPTSYEVRGQQLVQSVDTTGAQGQIVVDPRITYGAGIYLNARGYELNALRIAIIVAGGVLAVGTCALANQLPVPGPLKLLITAICAIGGVNLIQVFQAIVNHGPFNDNQCYQTRLIPSSDRFDGVGEENCSGL